MITIIAIIIFPYFREMALVVYMCQEKKEGRGLPRAEDCVDVLIQGIENYIK